MIRMSTRSSTRLSQVPEKSTESVFKNQLRSQASKVIIVDSDDSEDEYLHVTKPRSVLLTPKKGKSNTHNSELHEISPVTPPKQKKNCKDDSHTFCARTPQHRKIKVSDIQSPSSLIKKLNLISPLKTTIENKKTRSNENVYEYDYDKDLNSEEGNYKPIVTEEKQNRKNLFKETSDEENILRGVCQDNSSEYKENKLNDKKSEKRSNIYQDARRALHSAFPTDMPGREKELDKLRTFIKIHLKDKMSGSVYVSGPPGTGKTATLNMILQEDGIHSGLCTGYVNCTAIKSPTAIYSRIAKELGIKINGKTEKDYLNELEKHLRKNHKMTLLILDEIDQLESKNQSILYTIFEWPSKPNSRLILVGIANALDLTDRILPRLQARCELKPTLMHFAPYTKQQIIHIFTARLQAAGVLEVFSPVALQMLAAKVAAVSGDVRRALDIGRRVVELIDQNRSEDALKSTENKAKAVDLKQVVNVLDNVYGTSQNLSEESDDSFPLQQKIIVCSLLLILKKAKNKDVTVGRLHEVYRRVCSKRNLLTVDQAEFVGLCSLIETRGIIKIIGKKEPRLNKINLEWDEEEVAAALKDKQLMSMILQDDSCLTKL